MEILPSEYQQLELYRNEKIFIRNIMANDQYGFLLLKTNPAMLTNESMHILICSEGVVCFKFFEGFQDSAQYGAIMPMMVNGLYGQTVGIITSKLLANKALIDKRGKLRFPINVIYVFPAIKREEIKDAGDEALRKFTREHCLFKEELQRVRSELMSLEEELLAHPILDVSSDAFEINNDNVNSILQRIAPEYVTIRISTIDDTETKAGADNELLVVTENDAAVKAFRLDAEQINIVNSNFPHSK